MIALADPNDTYHAEAMRFIREAKRRKWILITSNVLLEEMRGQRNERKVLDTVRKYVIKLYTLHLESIERKAKEFILRRRLSAKRLFDIMHILAAKKLNAAFIVTYDTKLKRLAGKFKLKAYRPEELIR